MHLHRIRGAARHRVPRNHAISIVTENLLSPFAKNLLERFRDGSPIIGYGWGMLEPIRVSASGNLSQWGMDQARSPIRRPPKVTARRSQRLAPRHLRMHGGTSPHSPQSTLDVICGGRLSTQVYNRPQHPAPRRLHLLGGTSPHSPQSTLDVICGGPIS